MKGDLINRVHPIVEIKDLAATVNLTDYSFFDESIIVRLHIRLYRNTPLRSLIDDTHVTDSR